MEEVLMDWSCQYFVEKQQKPSNLELIQKARELTNDSNFKAS